LLLSELEQGQENKTYKITSDDRRSIRKNKYEKRVTKYGPFVVASLVIPYIDSDSTIGVMLRLNK